MHRRLERIVDVVSWPIERMTDRMVRTSESAVREPRLYRSLQKWSLVRMLVTVATALGVIFAFHGSMPWWAFLAWLWVMTIAQTGARGAAREASGYLHGWLEGRSTMIGSMLEARSRGIDPDSFMQAELERDVMTVTRTFAPGDETR